MGKLKAPFMPLIAIKYRIKKLFGHNIKKYYLCSVKKNSEGWINHTNLANYIKFIFKEVNTPIYCYIDLRIRVSPPKLKIETKPKIKRIGT